MECQDHEYHQPLAIKLSNFLSGFIPALGVAIWLPDDTNMLLGIFLIFCVVTAMDRLHFIFIEKPHIAEWVVEHMEKYHSKGGIKE